MVRKYNTQLKGALFKLSQDNRRIMKRANCSRAVAERRKHERDAKEKQVLRLKSSIKKQRDIIHSRPELLIRKIKKNLSPTITTRQGSGANSAPSYKKYF
jgi:hypothetical protein